MTQKKCTNTEYAENPIKSRQNKQPVHFMKTKFLSPAFILLVMLMPMEAQQLSYQKITFDVKKPKEYHMPISGPTGAQLSPGDIKINAVSGNKIFCTATDKSCKHHVIVLDKTNMNVLHSLALPEPYEKAASEYICQFGDKHIVSFLVYSVSRKKEPLYGIALVDNDLNIIKMNTSFFHFGVAPLYTSHQMAILGNGGHKFTVDSDLNIIAENEKSIVINPTMGYYFPANLHEWVIGDKLNVFVYNSYFQIDLNTLEVTALKNQIPLFTTKNASEHPIQFNLLHNDMVWAIVEQSPSQSRAQLFDYSGNKLQEYTYDGISDAILTDDGRLCIAKISPSNKGNIQIHILSTSGKGENMEFEGCLSGNTSALFCLRNTGNKIDVLVGAEQNAQVITIDLSNQTYLTIKQFSTNAYIGGKNTMQKREGKNGWYFYVTTNMDKFYYNNTESYNWRNSVFFLNHDYSNFEAWEKTYKHLLSPIYYNIINDVTVCDYALYSFSNPHYWSEKDSPTFYHPNFFLIDKDGKMQNVAVDENATFTQIFKVSETEYLLFSNYSKTFRLGELTITQ